MLRFSTASWVIALLAMSLPDSCRGQTPNRRWPEPLRASDIRVEGELGQRLQASFDRLEREDYQPRALFDKPNDGWPGDKEGRTLFGLTLLSQVTGRQPKYLEQTVEEYSRRINAEGYLGPIMSPDAISEQALGGQFWIVRTFYDYADWRSDPRVAAWADRVLEKVYLSAAGEFKNYPIDPASRKSKGFVYGQEVAKSGKWILSTDIGCGLAGSLDALTTAYARKPSAILEAAVDEAIARFEQMDLVVVSAQLHSTLISTRSLLRHYGSTGRPDLLEAAMQRYEFYRERAMTDTFENHNWFGRPEWTEGCAVVDSFIVAMQLWRYTADPKYLEDAHHIYYNGLCVNQRANGGFGCDSCPSVTDPFLTIKTPEAHWCCTQRGADGLASAATFTFFTDDKGAYVTFPRDAQATLRWGDSMLKIRTESGYPFQGRLRLSIVDVSNTKDPYTLRLFVPSWAANPKLELNGQTIPVALQAGFLSVERRWSTGDALVLTFDQQVVAKPPVNRANGADKRNYHTFHFGPLVLGADNRATGGSLGATGGLPASAMPGATSATPGAAAGSSGATGGLSASAVPAGTSEPDPIRLSSDTHITRQGDEFIAEARGVKLRPIYHLLDPAFAQERNYRRQILFQDEK